MFYEITGKRAGSSGSVRMFVDSLQQARTKAAELETLGLIASIVGPDGSEIDRSAPSGAFDPSR